MDNFEPEPESTPEAATPPQPPDRPRKSKSTVYALTFLAVLAIGVSALLAVRANQDKSDLEDQLESSEADVDRLTADVARLTADVGSANDQNNDLEARLGTLQSDLDAVNEQLVGAEEARSGVIDFIALSMTLGGGMSTDDGECVAKALVEEMGVAELLASATAAAGLADGSGDLDSGTLSFGLAVLAATEDCGVSLDVFEPGDGYGDNAALDALYDLCAEGLMASCDRLYLDSAPGSEYEQFALTCGDRFTLARAPIRCDTESNAAPVISGSPLPPFQAAQGDSALGLPVPTVIGVDFDSREVTIGTSGRPTAIVFLAHWCPHCQQEVPRVQTWLDEGGGIAGVEIVSVVSAVDPTRANYPPRTWLDGAGWTPPTLLDGTQSDVHSAFGAGGFPYWVFVSADGTVAARSEGELSIAALETFLEAIAP